MTARSPYGRTERDIAAAEAGTVRFRWEYGRRLACDPSATTPAGELRHGKIAELIEAAARVGVRLSEQEIRDRLRAALAYPCESQMRRARDCAGTWDDLVEAGFPEHEAEAGERPYDPRTLAEKAQQAERQLALGEPDQLTLFRMFPADEFSELSTLAELRKYAEDSAERTARHAAADERRLAYVGALEDAVGGDEGKTWAQAQAALDAKGGEA